MTPLDAAFAATEAHPEDDTARLRLYQQIADAELFLLLTGEPAGETLSPRVFPLEDGPVVLAFDSEDRLAAFTEGPAPYAALPGRIIAGQLAGQGIGLGLNLGVAPSSTILPAAAMDWLATTLASAPEETSAKPRAFHAPRALPETLTAALTAKLAHAGGLASAALLAAVDYADDRRGHMLAFLDARPGAESALARAVAEALTFSGVEAGELDVTFLGSSDPAAQALVRVARRFDLPEPVRTEPAAPAAPGMDPDRPPRLR
ncbi:hypothetical protein HYN69_08630 [Gemmobacter aquarius]|uniref:Uncharacterized protein n=1 Tax=Paragemmobacter aquarius TaxID=2169400 RepID=A0A2S0UL97_9RHOB|nr:SseB family protein [Gemmobacter aquarius]AWB48566.1 hypothetical protein HYN69_08630 [Gemmobacter aquarius]